MSTKKIFFFLLLALIARIGHAQQDPQFTQYMFNPLVLNPAYAGSREVINTVLLYRNQWVNLDGAPTTVTASINSPLKNKKMGLGFHIISDKIGPTTMNKYVASYAYRIRLGNGKLSFGLRAGLYDYRYDWGKIDYKDKADVFNAQQITKVVKPGFDFGMYYYNSSLYAGLAISHINFSKASEVKEISDYQIRTAPHLIGTIGKAFEINSQLTLRPSAVVRYTPNAPLSADFNASALLLERIWLGAGVRSNRDLLINVEYNITQLLRIGYSYDVSTQLIRTTNKGTHEFFLGFDIDFFKSKTISPRIFKYN
jgi:type IX secretion system PorP/SprF family membrane protein